MLTKEEYERIGRIFLDFAFEVHKELGPGLLESIYEECLCEEIRNKGLMVENQVYLPLVYKGKKLNKNFKIDILVEDAIVLKLNRQLTYIPLTKHN